MKAGDIAIGFKFELFISTAEKRQLVLEKIGI